MTNKPRVVLISHVYLEKQYRGKLPFIGQSADLTIISPNRFPFPYGLLNADFSNVRDYSVQLYPQVFPLPIHTSTRFILGNCDLGFRQNPPDIIYVENEESSFLLLQALLYRRWYAQDAKVVVFIWANQKLNGFKGAAQNALARWARTQVDYYIAGNLEGKSFLNEEGVSNDRVAVFPCVGADTAYFQPATSDRRLQIRLELGLSPDEFVIGFVGRFESEKGLDDLLAAFSQIRDTNTKPVRLICVGNGSLKEKLELLHPNVLTFSPGGSSQVLPYYQVLDVLVLPSRTTQKWKEQFGRVIVEAMACGVPVIGSSSGAIPEVIGDAGLIFQEGDVDQLSCRLSDLIGDGSLCQVLAEKGLSRIIQEYSDIQIASKTLHVFSLLVNK